MSDPSRSLDGISSSYEDGVKLMEKVLDSRRSGKGAAISRTEIPAFTPISFGDDQIQSVPQTSSSQTSLRTSNPAKKESQPTSSSNPVEPVEAQPSATTKPSDASSTPDEATGEKMSKNQLKKLLKAQNQAKFREQVALGQAVPKSRKGEKNAPQTNESDSNKQNTSKKEGQSEGKGNQDKAQQKPSKESSQAKKETPKEPSSQKKDQQTAKKTSPNNPAAATKSAVASTSSEQQVPDPARAKKAANTQSRIQYDDPKKRERVKKKQILSLEPTPRPLTLFSHLPQFETYKGTVSDTIMLQHPQIPTAFVHYGLQLTKRQIQGSNARCLAMIDAFIVYLRNYVPDPTKPFGVDLDAKIKPIIQFMVDCRPISIGMGNAINFLKRKIGDTLSDPNLVSSVEKSLEYLIEQLSEFRRVHILTADETIREKVASRIKDGDVILTYARSYIVSESLKHAKSIGKRFRVIVVDSKPRFEGKITLQELVDAGIECEYVAINAVSYIMKDITKVLIGAHALMSNGQVYSRAGTSVVCMMAHAYHVPVLVACESYKFCERVQLDAICQNELDDPDLLNVENLDGSNHLGDWKNKPTLKLLNLVYDLTPTEFISMVITEHGPVPPTSVPAVIREFHSAN